MEPKISMCMTSRGKEWLLMRMIEPLQKQTLSLADWELVVVDDCSPVPLDPYLNPLRDAGVQVQSYRLEHEDGWRGITVGMMYAFSKARAPIIAEMNSHLLLPPESVELLLLAHESADVRRVYCQASEEVEARLSKSPENLWVSLRVFNLNTEDTCLMDQVSWRDQVTELRKLPHTQDPWTRLWSPGGPNGEQLFGTHLCCSIRKSTFERLAPWPPTGFKDYGTDDPAYAGARQRNGILDLNVWPEPQMMAHLAHNNHLEDAMELVPTRLNKHGHTALTARYWDSLTERRDKPVLTEVIEFWESGQRTTDWRVREAWGWPFNPRPGDYSQLARTYLKEGKRTLEDLLPIQVEAESLEKGAVDS